ncbi:MAG: nucleotidyl transferase AbiEii/AbiGii toxin family protein [Saprospirales bacterium]|jgi:predicted nucleotidyltransferase component of viral defense system|nr:nucleotidyl transferase AbiEii/AbiGii toxin family protein [Saprospirales bacterium]MBK8922176.1 nucleotidyl transferase AbiEii/AbiGii toxin family protein [Saprospirales bacterium]
MMNLEQIATQFPPHLSPQKQAMLREYLQCVIVEILFESPFATKFSFLGDTCLRLVHGNTRFSEDLDFDNFGLTDSDFDAVAAHVQKGLEKQGYRVEVSNVHRGAYRCKIRFPGLLFDQGLSGHREEKILIQLDSESQGYAFQPQTFVLARFGLFTRLIVTPPELLLAQKLHILSNRPRAKGRDYFDVVFLFSQNHLPDYGYLEAKMSVGTPERLRTAIFKLLDQVDLNALAADVRPFLFNPDDDRRVRYFREFWEQVKL